MYWRHHSFRGGILYQLMKISVVTLKYSELMDEVHLCSGEDSRLIWLAHGVRVNGPDVYRAGDGSVHNRAFDPWSKGQ